MSFCIAHSHAVTCLVVVKTCCLFFFVRFFTTTSDNITGGGLRCSSTAGLVFANSLNWSPSILVKVVYGAGFGSETLRRACGSFRLQERVIIWADNRKVFFNDVELRFVLLDFQPVNFSQKKMVKHCKMWLLQSFILNFKKVKPCFSLTVLSHRLMLLLFSQFK